MSTPRGGGGGELMLVGARGVLARWPRARVTAVAHGDPPRLAVMERAAARRLVHIVDVATGAEHARFHAGLSDTLLGFDPSGSLLFGTADDGLECFTVAGEMIFSARGQPGAFSDRVDGVAFGAAVDGGPPATAVVWSGRRRRVAHVDLRDGLVREECAGDCDAVAADRDCARAIVAERDAFRVCVFDERAPRGLFAPPRVSRYPWSAWPLSRARSLWCDESLERFGLVTRDSAVHSFRMDERERGGVAVAVVDGTLRRLGATDGELPIVEGPTGVRDVLRHPRGVLALDAGERAHVVDVPAE